MSVLLALVLSLLFSLLLLSSYSPLKILDTPNDRSLHEAPTPRTGGLAIILAIFIGWAVQSWLYGFPEPLEWIVAAALLVAAVSFVDDLQELSPLIRMIVHAIAAVVLIAGGLVMFDGWFGILFTLVAITWMLNLYNFMDGMDGFAGGMTLFGFGFLSCAGWLQGMNGYAIYSLLISVAALGFLCVNFPPAKMFMGDLGSATLGLLAAAFSLWGIQIGLFTWWFPLLVFSPFVVDATVTLIRRGLNRERIWEAHCSHYYQRLVQMGWGHKKTVLAEYTVMILTGSSALLALFMNEAMFTAAVIIVWFFIYLLIALWIHKHECKESV